MEKFQTKMFPNKTAKSQFATSFNTTVKTIENWFAWMRRKKAEKEMSNRSEYRSVRYFRFRNM